MVRTDRRARTLVGPPPLLRHALLVAAGAAIGVLAYWLLDELLWILVRADGPWRRWVSWATNDSLLLVSVFGLAGLWLGFKAFGLKSGKAIYPLAFIIILAYPAFELIQARGIRLTPEAAADAHIADDVAHFSVSNRMPAADGSIRFAVKQAGKTVGTVDVEPVFKILWAARSSCIAVVGESMPGPDPSESCSEPQQPPR